MAPSMNVAQRSYCPQDCPSRHSGPGDSGGAGGRRAMTKAILAATLTVGVLCLASLLPIAPARVWSPFPASADNCAVRPTVSRPLLQLGSTGGQVAVLQAALTTSGFSSGYLDGLFGSPEDAAVKAFQQSRGLPATGVAGLDTWAAL